MRLQQDIDFTTLNWVKQELDETLKQARQALEAYVDDPADSSLMRFCATYLHQVQGTLRMVELYGAAMVVEEMERVAQGLLDDAIRNKNDAYEVLMRGIVQLPDYLERLQGGHKDIPIVLLPLLNDLRACRGEKLLSEGVLFSPDLSVSMPASAAGPDKPLPDAELKPVASRLRTNYQMALVKWLRDQTSNVAAAGLMNALDGLRSITFHEEGRRLWWVAGGLLDGVRNGLVDANQAVKLLFGRVDREIKRLADAGEQSFKAEPPRDLVKNLLYYAAHARGSDGRVGELKRTYKLEMLLPSDKEIEHARGTLSGRNKALLDTVSTAIKEDLMRVKDALDIVNRLVGQLGTAIRAAASVALIASVLVLAGALAAGNRARIHDAVVLKTLGATRKTLIAAFSLEYMLIGLATALFALAAGGIAAWFVVARIMTLPWAFSPTVALSTVALALVLTVGIGLVGTWRILGLKAAPVLRTV